MIEYQLFGFGAEASFSKKRLRSSFINREQMYAYLLGG